ncbi:MAG TPA: outer membrane protein transport protein, partial [Thermoanaerobaculia bacterium]|nr:outer membrane protein transport protein [Thermoanaerobaculia bacterium]
AFVRLFPIDTRLELDIENFGASIAYKFGSFSLGVSANYYQFEIAALTSRFDTALVAPFTEPGQFFGPPLYSPANVIATQVQSGNDEDLGINVGFLWELNPKFILGGSYRDGVSFDYDYVVACGPADPVSCNFPPRVGEPRFNVPSVWGVGIAIRPTDRFTIAIDYHNVEYSALTETFVNLAEPSNVPADFVVDDADEIHLGLEYVFANLRNPITIRVGAWEDPAHQIRYTGNAPTTSLVLWSGSNLAEDETHITGGLGFTLGENFGIDLAADFSERVDIMAISAFFRF